MNQYVLTIYCFSMLDKDEAAKQLNKWLTDAPELPKEINFVDSDIDAVDDLHL